MHPGGGHFGLLDAVVGVEMSAAMTLFGMPIDGERASMLREHHAQLAAVTDAANGGSADYARGEDGARNLAILEQIAP